MLAAMLMLALVTAEEAIPEASAVPATTVPSDTVWVTDQKGCALSFPRALRPNETIETDIPCVDGRLEGEGMYTFKIDGVTADATHYRQSAGLVLRGGYQVWQVHPENWHFAVRCHRNTSIFVSVPDSLALFHWGLFQAAMDTIYSRAKHIHGRCPPNRQEPGNPYIHVYILLRDPQPSAGPISVWNLRKSLLVECPYTGNAADCFRVDNWNMVRRERAKWVQHLAWTDRQRLAQNAASAQATAVAQARTNRLEARRALIARHAAQEVSLDHLRANPYVYQGKIVAVLTTFRVMRNATTAVFGGSGPHVIGRNVPSSRFASPQEVLLFGRVAGQSEEIVLGTPIPVPVLQFVDAYACQRPACAEIAP